MIRNSLTLLITAVAVGVILAGCEGKETPKSAGEDAKFEKFYKGRPNERLWHVYRVTEEPHTGGNDMGDGLSAGDAFRIKKMGNKKAKVIAIGTFLTRRNGKAYGNKGEFDAEMIETSSGAKIICVKNWELTDKVGKVHDDHYLSMQINPADPEDMSIKISETGCEAAFDHPGAAHARY